MKPILNCQFIKMVAETSPSPEKHVGLSRKNDRFGDPYARVQYKSTDFDNESHMFAKSLFEKFVSSTDAIDGEFSKPNEYWSGHHHMGTCRMGWTPGDSVVDQFGKVHDVKNLFVLGGSSFVSSSSVNPTLTMVALAMRTVDFLMDRILK